MTKKKIALITGANRGIGKEIARQLAVQGHHVLIGCRDQAKGAPIATALQQAGYTASVQVVDVNDPNSVKQAIANVTQTFGRIDILVNNAGVILDQGISVLDVTESVIKDTLETNFFGILRMTQAVIPLMKAQGYGRIVNLSSGLGAFDILQGLGGLKGTSSAYRISKTMLNALTCLVAQEAADYNIKVNAVCPGHVQTDMGGADAPSTVQEGADTAVWLATLDDDGQNGGYFRDRQPIAW